MKYLIPQQQYVSFDIFDTLIKRNVRKPTDIFAIVEAYCNNLKINCPKSFCYKRIEAERKANQVDDNASLDLIYEILEQECGFTLRVVKRIEVEVELEFCVPNNSLVDFYNELKRVGKNIYLISDMYLPKSVIKKMINKCGIEGYDRLFISCEAKAKKADGELFKKVQSIIGMQLNNWIHYGDNENSDFHVPRKIGLTAIHVKEKKDGNKESSLCLRTINRSIENCISLNKMSNYQAMGVKTFGPLLYGFIQWLKGNCREDKIDHILFMSRDGYMMKLAFDLINEDRVDSTYMYCSRRSFSNPLLWKCHEFEQLSQYISFSKNMSLRRLVLRMGLSPEEFLETAKSCSIDLDQVFYNHTIEHDEKVKKFFLIIKDVIHQLARKEFDMICQYLSELPLTDNVAVVDIGYHGTMQNGLLMLMEEMGVNANVIGYYLCMDKENSFIDNIQVKAKAFLYDGVNGNNIKKSIEYCTPILESIFLAPHGSVIKFENKSGIIQAVFEKYEYDNKDGQIIDEVKFISEYQEGALKFIKHVSGNIYRNVFYPSAQESFLNFSKLVNNPTLEEATIWGDIRFFDYSMMYIAKPEKNLYSGFLKCSWKVGYLKRIFKIPFCYDKLCGILRRLKR